MLEFFRGYSLLIFNQVGIAGMQFYVVIYVNLVFACPGSSRKVALPSSGGYSVPPNVIARGRGKKVNSGQKRPLPFE